MQKIRWERCLIREIKTSRVKRGKIILKDDKTSKLTAFWIVK